MTVINTLGPLVLFVGLGAVLYRTGFLSADIFKANSRLVYWVGLPCLLFSKTARPAAHLGPAMKVFVVLLMGMAVCALLAYLVGWLLRLTRWSLGAFVQASFRGNLAYVGLPVIFFSLVGPDGIIPPEQEALAVLSITPLIPIYNLVAVSVLVAGQAEANAGWQKHMREVAFRTVTNPLIIACILGVVWSFTGWELPTLVARSCETIAGFALPLALFAVGASLKLEALKEGIRIPAAGALIKVAIGPAAGFLIGKRIGLSAVELQTAMLFLACPTAVMSFVMAEQLGNDEELTARIIVASSLLALPSLAAILMLSRWF